MDVLKKIAKLKALKWKLFKYGKFEDIQAQEVDMVFLFILQYESSSLRKPLLKVALRALECANSPS
jgi:hypothetical protein